MAQTSPFLASKRYAVVTGANKGIGLEVCRQLATEGVVVVLTSRDEKRGLEALENLKKSGLSSDNLEFHQLDVTNPASAASLADFIKAKFGKLDILVNNAGVLGATADRDALIASGFYANPRPTEKQTMSYSDMLKQTYELAEECVETNYYGVRRNVEALLPLLQNSDSPRIVNVSSGVGKLANIPNEQIRGVLSNADTLTEERVDEILKEFLSDFKEGSSAEKGWPAKLPAYFVSKAALNAYTRIIAAKYPSVIINCVCPGFVKTSINGNTGNLPLEEGGARAVRLALLPHGSPSGLFYSNNEVIPF
ncbi:(+)-neomenthol dehydrogenase-like [Silene latifolia]|uniref:(+)-neomenthol dehydrogenase-like n=1 Tax=Silene latifolia TaxID=37657 RepID=UPI003D76CCC2